MNRIQTISSALGDLQQRLEDWRQQRGGRCRIPEPFWAEALTLARAEGASRVSRVLRLPYRRLKDAQNNPVTKSEPDATPTFVELSLEPSAHGRQECLVEMTHRSGAKMMIHLPAASTGELLPLAQAFWSHRR
jgi:hypothetical protein